MKTHSFIQNQVFILCAIYLIKNVFNLMDNKRTEAFEDVGDSEQPLQFNSFLQEIGFYKQRISEQESQVQEHVMGTMVASSESQNKRDINATYNMVNIVPQEIDEDYYPYSLSQKEDIVKEQSQQWFPKREEKIAQIMMAYKRIQSGVSQLKMKIRKIGSAKPLKNMVALPKDEKNFDSLDNFQKASKKTSQNAVICSFGKGMFTPGFFQTPVNSLVNEPLLKNQIPHRVSKIPTRIIRKDKKEIGPPLFEREQRIYFDLQGFQINEVIPNQTEQGQGFVQQVAKAHRTLQKRNWIAMQLAIFQAYKQDNQKTIQQSISFLYQVLLDKNSEPSYLMQTIRSYFLEYFKIGFRTFFKNSSSVLQKIINQIIQKFQQHPIEEVDIRIQILSQFYRNQYEFNEYRFKKHSKFEGPQLKYHLKMLNYSSSHLQKLKRCFVRHYHQINYLDLGHNLHKIANTYAFLLRKAKLEKISNTCFLVPNKKLIQYIKNVRNLFIKERPQMLDQRQRQTFSFFSRNIRKYRANIIQWTQKDILAIINIFDSLIDNYELANSDRIRQITNKYGRTFKSNNELFKKYHEKISISYHKSAQKIDQDKFKLIRRLFFQEPFISYERIQRKMFLKHGIFISIKQIEQNIDVQMQILMKQLLFEYMEKSLHQITVVLMSCPLAIVDVLSTVIPIQFQSSDLEQTIIKTQVRQVSFYVAVTNKGETVCNVYLQKKSLDKVFNKLVRQLGNITFAYLDKDFLSKNWFQRPDVIKLYKKKNKMIPIPSFVETFNPCKKIIERIQQQLRTSPHSQESLLILAQKIVTQAENKQIQSVFAKKFSKSKALFGQLRANHQKDFGVSRELQFQDMKLVISKELVSQQGLQLINFKCQKKKIGDFMPLMAPKVAYSFWDIQEKDCEQERSLGQKISGIISNISLLEKKMGIDTLKMYNQKEMFLSQLLSQYVALKSSK